MSINSLFLNPEILDELVDKINNVQPKKSVTSLLNSDGNLTVSNTPTQGSISIANEPNVDIINTPKIISEFVHNINLIESLNSTGSVENQISFTQSKNTISTNNNLSSILLDENQNLQLIQTKLKKINMINPYSSDGAPNDLLSSDGQGGITWQSNNGVNTLKYIFNDFKQQVATTSDSELSIYSSSLLSGFTIGRRIEILVNFSYYEQNNVPAVQIIAILNNDQIGQQIVNSSYDVDGSHITRSVNFNFINTQDKQTIDINLQINGGGNIYFDGGDYVSILIYEN